MAGANRFDSAAISDGSVIQSHRVALQRPVSGKVVAVALVHHFHAQDLAVRT